MRIDQYISQSSNPDTRAYGSELISTLVIKTPTPTEILTVGIVSSKMGYICAELRKPVEDTVYRKLLSQRADDIGYVYFVGMPFGA